MSQNTLSGTSQSIILDTYSSYLINPSHLLYKRVRNGSCESMISYGRPSASPNVSPNRSTPTVTSHNPPGAKPIKPLPNLVLELAHQDLVDLDDYKKTNRYNAYIVSWKPNASRLQISPNEPDYNQLTIEELETCSILRLLPSIYLHIKKCLLNAVCLKVYKKREAQKWFRTDVNKISILYDWFKGYGWIPENELEWQHRLLQYK